MSVSYMAANVIIIIDAITATGTSTTSTTIFISVMGQALQ